MKAAHALPNDGLATLLHSLLLLFWRHEKGPTVARSAPGTNLQLKLTSFFARFHMPDTLVLFCEAPSSGESL
jgi:hypothetical protein